MISFNWLPLWTKPLLFKLTRTKTVHTSHILKGKISDCCWRCHAYVPSCMLILIHQIHVVIHENLTREKQIMVSERMSCISFYFSYVWWKSYRGFCVELFVPHTISNIIQTRGKSSFSMEWHFFARVFGVTCIFGLVCSYSKCAAWRTSLWMFRKSHINT